ncbi:hypothetical protein O5D80_001061 [Batrachochytrium dendrobatidis]|nr:hypothetical protein O5D80_001061 [Batrachochytrium dendrobatidis]
MALLRVLTTLVVMYCGQCLGAPLVIPAIFPKPYIAYPNCTTACGSKKACPQTPCMLESANTISNTPGFVLQSLCNMPQLIWTSRDDLHPCQEYSGLNLVEIAYGIDRGNLDIVRDPTGYDASVWRVLYPGSSYRPKAIDAPIGGAGFYSAPIDLSNAKSVTYQYDVLFPVGFDFVKGGKLPGLFGGHPECSGGAKALDCFSTRLMFRAYGDGELYLYSDKNAQDPRLCINQTIPLVPGTVCDDKYGTSIGRGAWRFPLGEWTSVQQTITLNTIDSHTLLPNRNGLAVIRVNGDTVIDTGNIVYQTSNIGFAGIDFETFFGGSTNDWATPRDQVTYFRKQKLKIEY